MFSQAPPHSGGKARPPVRPLTTRRFHLLSSPSEPFRWSIDLASRTAPSTAPSSNERFSITCRARTRSPGDCMQLWRGADRARAVAGSRCSQLGSLRRAHLRQRDCNAHRHGGQWGRGACGDERRGPQRRFRAGDPFRSSRRRPARWLLNGVGSLSARRPPYVRLVSAWVRAWRVRAWRALSSNEFSSFKARPVPSCSRMFTRALTTRALACTPALLHLHQDRAHRCTPATSHWDWARPPATSAPGLGSPPSHLHHDWPACSSSTT